MSDNERDRDLEVDAAFADLVSRWDDSGQPTTVPQWPAEAPPEPGGDAGADSATALLERPVTGEAPPRSDAPETTVNGQVVLPPVAAWRPSPPPVDLDADEGFVPPDPPPLPRGELSTRLAWCGTLGAPVFLLILALAWPEAPRWVTGVTIAAFVAGFIALVAAMPDGPRDGEDPDDGAVV